MGAFEELCRRCDKMILERAYYRVWDRDLSEDIRQETLLHLLARADQYDPSQGFSTYLRTIVDNLCRDMLRHMRVREVRLPEPPAEEELLDISAERQELHEIVMRLARKLEPNLYTSFILRFSEEHSYEEIGKILDIPAGTARSRCFLARQRIKETICRMI